MNKTFVETIMKEQGFNGVILLSKNQEIEEIAIEGYANIELGVPLTKDSVFRIASLSKQITATAMLRLYEDGKINLDDTLDQYIPDYPRGNEITIHQIMTNSAGIPNFDLFDDFYDAFNHDNPMVGLIEMFKYKDLRFTPGKEYEYSNSGYILLQYIIETVSGTSYDDYLHNAIYNKAKMTSTQFDFYQQIIPNRVSGYDVEDGVLKNARFIDMRVAGGGGGLTSTIQDLFRFHQALKDNKIISQSSYDLMYTGHIKASEQSFYGYGVITGHSTINGKRYPVFYHSGGGPGVRALYMEYPNQNIQLIMLSNINDGKKFLSVYEQLQEHILK